MGDDSQLALVSLFGDDLQALLDQLGGEIESALELTRLVSTSPRKASFKLTLRDGRQVKARRHRTADSFSSVVALLPLLEPLPFSRCIAGAGRVTIEQWVEGIPLAVQGVSAARAREAGDLLGRVHTTTDLPGSLLAQLPTGNWYADSIGTHLQELVAAGALSSPQGATLLAMAHASQPASFDTGLIHGDFCADNMVVDGSGRVFVVDNESLQLGALDFDLARCWARWPMSPESRSAFTVGYARHRALDGLAAHARFWAIKALSQSIAVHLRYDRSCHNALDALLMIARDGGGGLWPEP